MLLEGLLAVAVTAWSLAVWPLLGGLIGAVVAVAWTLGSTGVHYARCDADAPTTSMIRLTRKIWILFLLSLLALSGLLFARSEPQFSFVVGVATASASLTLSSLSACLWVCAMHVDWAAPYVAEYERTSRDLWLTEQLLQEAQEIAAGRMPLRRRPADDDVKEAPCNG
jgi:hypothetical protein